MPLRGEIINETGLEFEVLDADPRRAKKIRIRFKAEPLSEEPETDETASEDHDEKPAMPRGAAV